MQKLLLIDPLGRANGMERWHVNFTHLTRNNFDLSILSNYSSSLTQKCFTYNKQKKIYSLISIFSFGFFGPVQKVNKVALAHYGESFNTLLFLPAILKYPRAKRYLLIHDAVSTLKSERKGIRNLIGRIADKLLIASFDNLIVHNASVSEFFSQKKTYYLPLPPTTLPITIQEQKRTNKFVFWGFIKRSKNVEFIVELAKLMPDKVFDIYGTFINIEYRASFLETIERNRLPNLNFFETFIREEDVRKILCQYDAVLLPYTFITNSGILQTNADYCAISVTSDLPAFRTCSDISKNIELDLVHWKAYLETLDEHTILREKHKIVTANKKRVSEFMNRLNALNNEPKS